MTGTVIVLALLGVLAAASAEPVENLTIPSNPEDHNCAQYEVWYICGKACEATCSDPCPRHDLCPKMVCTNKTAACHCQPGYVRDTAMSGQCMLQIDCPVLLG